MDGRPAGMGETYESKNPVVFGEGLSHRSDDVMR